MLLAFRSQCIILSWESSWRYCIPRAIPSIILYRVSQSNCPCFFESKSSSKERKKIKKGEFQMLLKY